MRERSHEALQMAIKLKTTEKYETIYTNYIDIDYIYKICIYIQIITHLKV